MAPAFATRSASTRAPENLAPEDLLEETIEEQERGSRNNSNERDKTPNTDRDAPDTSTEPGAKRDTPAETLSAIEARIADLIEQERTIQRIKEAQARERELQQSLAKLRGEIANTPSKPRRNSSGSDNSRDLPLPEVKPLRSTPTLRRRDEWLSDLELAYEGAPKKFKAEKKRVLFAVQCLDPEPRAMWHAHLRDIPAKDREANKTDLGYFQRWTLTLIKDAANREAMIADEFEEAKQRENQSPQEFHTYLSSLERHFERASEARRASIFFSKLDKGLKDRIKGSGKNIPSTRDEVVTLATRFWDLTATKRKYTPSGESRPNKTNQPPSYSRSRGARPGGRREGGRSRNQSSPNPYPPKGEGNPLGSDSKPLRCYQCNSTAHLLPACPDKASYKPGNANRSR
jgi:hypothetical protein